MFITSYSLYYCRLMPKTGRIRKVYKSGRGPDRDGVIITLEIPAHASRYQEISPVSSDHFKCRASEAKVLKIEDAKTGTPVAYACSHYKPSFKYVVGETIFPEYGYSSAQYACAPGIHFWMSEKLARKWLSRYI